MRKFKVLVIGDIVIDHYINSKKNYIGGSATNVALTISRNSLEFKIDLLGVIGKDKPGNQLFSRLKDTNINLDKIIKLSGRTAKASWKRKKSGTELVKVDKGIDQGISLEYLKTINIENYDLIHATPYSLGINEIKYIRDKSKVFSFDSSFIYELKEIFELIPGTNWFFISGEFARNHQWIEKLSSYPEEGLILLNGDEGAMFLNSNSKIIEVSTKQKDNIYDDLGAGDVFIGYLLSSFYKSFNKNNIINLLERATEAAGKACQYEGSSNLSLV